nr:MAG TPA: hypothetical protein [Caudoviricetes sp.]
MRIKLRTWDEVVTLAKKHGDFTKRNDGTVMAFSLTVDDLPWGRHTEVVDVDSYNDYLVLNASGDNCWFVHSYMIDDTSTTSDDLLRYGKIITDDVYGSVTTNFGKQQVVRIRLIAYESELWYHKMVDGDVVERRKVGMANA